MSDIFSRLLEWHRQTRYHSKYGNVPICTIKLEISHDLNYIEIDMFNRKNNDKDNF